MNKRQIALARLAERETNTISASCEIFIQYGSEISDGNVLVEIERKMAKIQDQADSLNRRLQKLLAPYEQIDVEEIY